MPAGVWLVIGAMVVVAVVVLLVALVVGRRDRTKRLQARFGPEYEQAVSAAGTKGAAEMELVQRERHRDELDIVALPLAAQRHYCDRWRRVQAGFIDDPARALGEADRLVTEVMRERGYPVGDVDQRLADLSVDHPTVVAKYRVAHDIQLAQHSREVQTEEQRQALVNYRALLVELLEVDPDADADTPAPRGTGTAQETSP